MKQLLKTLFNKYQIEYNDEKLNKLEEFYKIVIEENKKFNLTAITEKEEFAIKHILDCALIIKLLSSNARVIDVGAGAGFPSIVIKILKPDLNITMIDSLNKRVTFLNETILKLNLTNIEAYHFRAEDYAIKNREKFDFSIARAVANLSTLSEYCIPLTKVGGKFIAMKGSSYKEEIETSKNAIEILGGKITDIQKIMIDENQSERCNIVVEKISITPKKYPRGKNLPRLKPII